MVSELRSGSYAVAVVGETSHGIHPATSTARSPDHAPPAANSQGIPVPQRNNSEDIENPLYLSANENPNAVLVSPVLTGSGNYASWSISMRVALEVKNKWGLVNGSIPVPDKAHTQYGAWRRCNLIMSSWILRSVHTSIAQSVMYIGEAKEIWNDLRRRFSQQDSHRISSLQNEIYGLK
ncbi:PREDICTED: uncharacterized protein LOC109166186 [Ipomoea nil]|uniref:uncharacterized protein LOC109166186 n=1 Tax=Ipomoea nil TaxID=35883 RepID=UPI000901968D|nr:PREDICTED: uncharacterized protein LOC109166186 [Ipomoea nil]